MSCYQILLASPQLAEVDGLTRQAEGRRFREGRQPGAFDVPTPPSDRGVCRRVETTTALEARGLSSASHRRYLKRLPASLALDDASERFNLTPAALTYLGVVGDDSKVNVRQAFAALGLDTSLLDAEDN